MLNLFHNFNVRTFIRAAAWGPVIFFFVEHGFSIGSIQGRSMQVSVHIVSSNNYKEICVRTSNNNNNK